jgi:hypothetical protein
MDTPALKFDNEVQITLRSSVTGKVLGEYTSHNDVSDDILASGRNIYSNDTLNDVRPWCFLLRDGPLWSGFTWDRKNPWAPYTCSPNNLYGGSFDGTANPHWRAYSSCSYVGGRWKLFYQWTQLADDLQLKALGLTGWDADQSNLAQKSGCITNAWSVFTPQTLIVLPTPIPVKGRKGGTQVQDILEISYYLSVVGVN